MKPDVYIAGDYAGLKTNNLTAYYGYEETEDDEWCFVARFGNEVIRIPASKLKVRDKTDCQECLLMGLAWLTMKYHLTL
jgi:hypothetical protein